MTDVDTHTEAGDDKFVPFIADVPLKFGLVLEQVNFDEIDIETYRRWLIKGAQAELTSARMGKKATGVTKLEGAAKEKALAEFLEQCTENFNDAKAGKPLGKTKGTKVSGAVGIEAMRLAKLMVKQHIKDNNQRVGAYSAKDITEAAKKVLEGNPELIKKAEETLAARAGDAKAAKGMDLTALFGEQAKDPEKMAKPKGANLKAKAKGDKPPLSAKQASIVAPRQKPEAHAGTKH